MAHGKPDRANMRTLAGKADDKTHAERHFPVRSLDDVLRVIRQTSGTGKLEIHFRDGQARGEAKWKGFLREEA